MITFKYIHGLVDCDFNILRNSDIHRYNTRKKNDFRLPLVRTNYRKKRLLYQGIKEWNLLEQSLTVKDIGVLSKYNLNVRKNGMAVFDFNLKYVTVFHSHLEIIRFLIKISLFQLSSPFSFSFASNSHTQKRKSLKLKGLRIASEMSKSQ